MRASAHRPAPGPRARPAGPAREAGAGAHPEQRPPSGRRPGRRQAGRATGRTWPSRVTDGRPGLAQVAGAPGGRCPGHRAPRRRWRSAARWRRPRGPAKRGQGEQGVQPQRDEHPAGQGARVQGVEVVGPGGGAVGVGDDASRSPATLAEPVKALRSGWPSGSGRRRSGPWCRRWRSGPVSRARRPPAAVLGCDRGVAVAQPGGGRAGRTAAGRPPPPPQSAGRRAPAARRRQTSTGPAAAQRHDQLGHHPGAQVGPEGGAAGVDPNATSSRKGIDQCHHAQSDGGGQGGRRPPPGATRPVPALPARARQQLRPPRSRAGPPGRGRRCRGCGSAGALVEEGDVPEEPARTRCSRRRPSSRPRHGEEQPQRPSRPTGGPAAARSSR